MLLESWRRGWLWEEKRPLPLRESGMEWGITWLRQRGGWRGFTSILSYPLEQGVRPCTQECPVCEAGLTWGQSWGTCVREMTRDEGRDGKAAVSWGFLSYGCIFSWKTPYLSNPAQMSSSVAYPGGNWTHGNHTPPTPRPATFMKLFTLLYFKYLSFVRPISS